MHFAEAETQPRHESRDQNSRPSQPPLSTQQMKRCIVPAFRLPWTDYKERKDAEQWWPRADGFSGVLQEKTWNSA